MTIQRVGIVAKQGLVAASEHVARLGPWLRERDIEALYERDTATLAGDTAHGATTMTRDALPREVDLVIVLGGDGTLLSMAARIAQSGRDVPDPRCEFRQPRISDGDPHRRTDVLS